MKSHLLSVSLRGRYGASGSGKTYTMVGPHGRDPSHFHRSASNSGVDGSKNWGLALRALEYVMDALVAGEKEGRPQG